MGKMQLSRSDQVIIHCQNVKHASTERNITEVDMGPVQTFCAHTPGPYKPRTGQCIAAFH